MNAANARDVGRGIARVDPEIMAKLGIHDAGEIVGLKGRRETAVKIMPTFPEFRGRGIIQIDGIIRDNAQAGLNEQVILHTIRVAEARNVILSPLTYVDRTRWIKL